MHSLLSRRSTHSWLAGLLLAGIVALPVQAQSTEPRQGIQVQAQAEVSVAPDMATLDARLWERTPALAQGSDARPAPDALAEARKRLEKRTGELIRTLERAGLDSHAISAGSLIVRPDYISQPSRDGGPDQTLVRTQLERPISLRITDLEKLPTILDALTEAGVDALEGVNYDLQDRDAAGDRALAQALEKARGKARLIADTLGVELGRVQNVQEMAPPVFAPHMATLRADGMESKTQAEYRPGEISIETTVSVAWEITP
ncbi:MAG: SIMPL domain-containing protein [Halomonas sp.]|nr:SIMPL domain-containing protein [Halomonas sp.]